MVQSTGQLPGSPGQAYTFRLDASDHTGNQASAEDATGVSRVTKYYYAAGQRVAMRAGDVVYYLHGDHLGSTSLTTNASGGVTARQLYYPYGEVRWGEGAAATDFGFTGQRSVAGTGLVFMHARFYDPLLGRFVSADTIVPDPGNPQDLNRYAYVRNNPLMYIDPSGHAADHFRNSKYCGPPPQPEKGAFQREINRVLWNTVPSVNGSYVSVDMTVKPAFVVGSTSGLEAMYVFNWRSGEFSIAGSVNMGSIEVGTPQLVSGEITRGQIAGMGYSSNDAFLGPSIDYELSLEGDMGAVSKGIVLGTSRETDLLFNPETGQTEWVPVYDEVSQMQPHTYYIGGTISGDIDPYPVPVPFDASVSAGVSYTAIMATFQLFPWKWKDESVFRVDVADGKVQTMD
ncbi:MAG: RHS repeat-associated core domain-containing protein [Chloroflexi bacterium]|nr:RHS repeat-associated core domain-containing protein [Chloroflexota bacterium]